LEHNITIGFIYVAVAMVYHIIYGMYSREIEQEPYYRLNALGKLLHHICSIPLYAIYVPISLVGYIFRLLLIKRKHD